MLASLRPLVAAGCLAAALAGCSTPQEPPTAPALPAQNGRESASAGPGSATEFDTHDVYAILKRGTGPLDRIARLDETLSIVKSVDVPGTGSHGALPIAGGASVVLVPRTPRGIRRPTLVLFDVATLVPSVLCDVAPEVAPGWKARPIAPFFLGADVPDLVAVPLLETHPTGTTVFDVSLRVVNVRERTWFDVDVPPDVVWGALFATPDGSIHAAVSTSAHELFDVDLSHRRVRAVTRGAFLPSPRRNPQAGAVALRGFALVAEEPRVVAVNRNGDTVRIALADGATTGVRLPIAGLGTDVFVEGLTWSASSQRFALRVLRAGDPGNYPSHVVLLDGDLRATGVEITTPLGLQQTMFSPHGTELIVLLIDGSLRRYRVSDGAPLSASPPGFAADAILGVR